MSALVVGLQTIGMMLWAIRHNEERVRFRVARVRFPSPPLPPLWVPENSDGTLAWPGAIYGTWWRIERPSDVPPAYLDGPFRGDWLAKHFGGTW